MVCYSRKNSPLSNLSRRVWYIWANRFCRKIKKTFERTQKIIWANTKTFERTQKPLIPLNGHKAALLRGVPSRDKYVLREGGGELYGPTQSGDHLSMKQLSSIQIWILHWRIILACLLLSFYWAMMMKKLPKCKQFVVQPLKGSDGWFDSFLKQFFSYMISHHKAAMLHHLGQLNEKNDNRDDRSDLPSPPIGLRA